MGSFQIHKTSSQQHLASGRMCLCQLKFQISESVKCSALIQLKLCLCAKEIEEFIGISDANEQLSLITFKCYWFYLLDI